MATVPTPDESANIIWNELKKRNLRSGDVIQPVQLQTKLFSKLRNDEFKAGCSELGNRGWLTLNDKLWLVLTDEGFTAL